jgi:uncharacterized protein
MKLLVWLLIGLWIYGVWRSRRIFSPPTKASSARKGHESPSPQDGPIDMVACAHCGLHIPVTDALRGRSSSTLQWFCCPAHQKAHQKLDPHS